MTQVRKVGLLGGGLIGGGWAARCALQGIDVTVYDPDPEADGKIARLLENARLAYDRLSGGKRPAEGRITFTGDIAEAVGDADFIQESAPERLALKQELLAAGSRAAPPETIIGSSTSGLLPSQLQADMVAPERFCVGHPFQPVYLMPLVEVVGGEKTAPETIDRARAIYTGLGMHALHVRKEIDAFIADRLMEAVWREALHMIKDGVATADELDQAMIYGPGLRWAFMGTFLTYRLGGGEAGMRHFLSMFAPTIDLPWTKLEGPPMTDELIDTIARQSDEQAGDVSIQELGKTRDACLISVLEALEANDYAAGKTVRTLKKNLGA